MLRMGKDVRNDDEVRETPGTVVWAVAAATAPLPFLGVYAVLFIVHGTFNPVAPPDITSTTGGELVAGIIAAALFMIDVIALLWMLNGRRRWLFVLVQLGMLGTAIDFFVDVTKGGRLVSFVVALASLIALACAAAPQSWEYFGQQLPRLRRRPAVPDDAAGLTESEELSRDPQSV
jgi:hypothetical protein